MRKQQAETVKAQIAKIVALKRAGVTRENIGKRFGVSRGFISDLLATRLTGGGISEST